jgi:hypothetical protein
VVDGHFSSNGHREDKGKFGHGLLQNKTLLNLKVVLIKKSVASFMS